MTLSRSRVVMVVAAALALVSCTTEPASTPDPSTAAPSSEAAQMVAAVSRFMVEYRLSGSTTRSRAVPVMVPEGLRLNAAREPGRVSAGEGIGRLSVDETLQATLEAQASTSTYAASRLALLRSQAGTVVAAVDGRLARRADQERILSDGFDVIAPLNPLQQLRLQGITLQGTAGVETVFGPTTATCAALWIDTVGAHCRLPQGTETASDLRATLTLRSAPIDVVALPARYVGYDSETADYYVEVLSGAGWVKTPVVVGATDGVRRVIVSGLTDGTRLRALDGSE